MRFDTSFLREYIDCRKSNTRQKSVNSSSSYRRQFPPGTARRALSYLLLTLILFGTTVEAVHRHGGASGTTTPAASHSKPDSQFAGGLVDCTDCLICQFHQSCSTALIIVRAATELPQLTSRFSATNRLALLTHAHPPQIGRAPPSTL
jgi:hypothetical protein